MWWRCFYWAVKDARSGETCVWISEEDEKKNDEWNRFESNRIKRKPKQLTSVIELTWITALALTTSLFTLEWVIARNFCWCLLSLTINTLHEYEWEKLMKITVSSLWRVLTAALRFICEDIFYRIFFVALNEIRAVWQYSKAARARALFHT